MHHYAKTLAIGTAAAFILCACGKQHKAEETVKDFLDTNLAATDYSVDFTKIDSTRFVADSAVHAMRTSATANAAFKKDIKYGANPPQRIYVFTKAAIFIGEDTLLHTFYLTPEMTQVVSFKNG